MVGVEVDLTELGSHAGVEAAGGDVDVLGLDLELGAALLLGAGRGALEECPAHASPLTLGSDADVPEAGQVFAPFAVA